MNWTPEERLALIYELACMAREQLRQTQHLKTRTLQIHDTQERIQFLCRMSSYFLEANKDNYADVIASAAQGASHE